MEGPFNFDDFLKEVLADAPVADSAQAAAADPDTAQVKQLASAEWNEIGREKLQTAGEAWTGPWTLVRADCNPDLYWWMHPDHGDARLIAQSLSGQTYYGERWHEGTWEPVCIKKKPASTRSEHLSVWAERSALEAMRVAMQGQPGPHCVSYLLDSYPVGYPCSEWPGNEQEVYCILEYAGGVELWYFLNEERLRFEQDLPNSRQELLQTIKDCCRQILKGVAVLHGCGWAHVNLKWTKLLFKRLLDGTIHCTITDLGSALKEDEVHQPEEIRPTVPSMAPELVDVALQGRSLHSISWKAVDMWSIGCIFAQMLTGTSPFQGPLQFDPLGSLALTSQQDSFKIVAGRHAKWEADRDAGSPVPAGEEAMAKLISDVDQHRLAARLMRRLLHPDPKYRPTVQQALQDDFLFV